MKYPKWFNWLQLGLRERGLSFSLMNYGSDFILIRLNSPEAIENVLILQSSAKYWKVIYFASKLNYVFSKTLYRATQVIDRIPDIILEARNKHWFRPVFKG